MGMLISKGNNSVLIYASNVILLVLLRYQKKGEYLKIWILK